MFKTLAKPFYRMAHDVLFATAFYNPLFKKEHHNKKVIKGFIGDEHLSKPELDNELFNQLIAKNIVVKNYVISLSAYNHYMQQAQYPASYYGGGNDSKQNFLQKTLEHYVSQTFFTLKHDDIFLDVAACTSPFATIMQKHYGANVYKQDLIYPNGINQNKIGGYAHQTQLPSNSVKAITLHCSLEHFEDNTDILFFKEVNRILKIGGKAIILPFYFAHTYTIHIDPAFNLLHNHHPVIDNQADLRYCNWYQFHSRHYDICQLQQRIIKSMPQCDIIIHKVENYKVLQPSGYLRWILEITKKADNIDA
jgi:hypothetical protein